MKNFESPPIRYLVHDHIQVSRLMGYFVIIQREELYKRVSSWCREELYKKVSSWCREELYRFDKGCFVKWCTRVKFGMYHNQDKENFKRGAWGLDIGHEDHVGPEAHHSSFNDD